MNEEVGSWRIDNKMCLGKKFFLIQTKITKNHVFDLGEKIFSILHLNINYLFKNVAINIQRLNV